MKIYGVRSLLTLPMIAGLLSAGFYLPTFIYNQGRYGDLSVASMNAVKVLGFIDSCLIGFFSMLLLDLICRSKFWSQTDDQISSHLGSGIVFFALSLFVSPITALLLEKIVGLTAGAVYLARLLSVVVSLAISFLSSCLYSRVPLNENIERPQPRIHFKTCLLIFVWLIWTVSFMVRVGDWQFRINC